MPDLRLTTAFSELARGRPVRSFLAQPMGFVLALATAVVGVIALAASISGQAVWINWYRVNPIRMVWAFLILLFGGWAFKVVFGLATGALPAR